MSVYFVALSDYGGDLPAAVAAQGTNETTIAIDVESREIDPAFTTIPSNITLMFVGGILTIMPGYSLTLDSPSNIQAPPRTQIFAPNGSRDVYFDFGGDIPMGWWGMDINALYYAINSVSQSTSSKKAVILIPNVTLEIPAGSYYQARSWVQLRGLGAASVIKSQATSRSQPLLEIDGDSDFIVENICFDGNGATGEALINFKGNAKNVTIQNCFFKNAENAGSLRPGNGKTIENIMFFENTFENIDTSVYLGDNETSPGVVQLIKILGNTLDSSGSIGPNGSGIYFHQGVMDVLIEGNIIKGHKNAGINLAKAGDRVSIVGNIMIGNKWGVFCENVGGTNPKNSHQIIITGNTIQGGSEYGIYILNIVDNKGPYLIDIADNDIFNNAKHGIFCQGRQIRIANNNVYHNATSTENDYCGVYLKSLSSTSPTENIIISNNQITNNGATGKLNRGLFVDDDCRSLTIVGNVAVDDDYLPNSGLQNHGVELKPTVNDVIFKSNRCRGVGALSSALVIGDGASILGETVSCEIGTSPASISPETFVEMPVFVAPSNTFLQSSLIVNGASMPLGSPPSELLEIIVYGAGIAFSKSSASSPAIQAFEPNAMPYAASNPQKHLVENSVVTFKRTPTGVGIGLTKMRLVLNYLTF